MPFRRAPTLPTRSTDSAKCKASSNQRITKGNTAISELSILNILLELQKKMEPIDKKNVEILIPMQASPQLTNPEKIASSATAVNKFLCITKERMVK
jgi:hypothetical protein